MGFGNNDTPGQNIDHLTRTADNRDRMNTAMTDFDGIFTEMQSVALPASGTHDMTSGGTTKKPRAAFYQFTGTLSGTVTVDIHPTPAIWMVWNNTNQSLIFRAKVSSGGAGRQTLTVTSGNLQMILVDSIAGYGGNNNNKHVIAVTPAFAGP